jgi:hypothetical protein
MSVPLIRAGAVCSTALCWLPAASVFPLTEDFIKATENPRRAGCGRQFSVFPPGVLLAAGNVLPLDDAGVKSVPTGRGNWESAPDRMRGEDVHQESFHAIPVFLAALFAATREGFSEKALGE